MLPQNIMQSGMMMRPVQGMGIPMRLPAQGLRIPQMQVMNPATQQLQSLYPGMQGIVQAQQQLMSAPQNGLMQAGHVAQLANMQSPSQQATQQPTVPTAQPAPGSSNNQNLHIVTPTYHKIKTQGTQPGQQSPGLQNSGAETERESNHQSPYQQQIASYAAAATQQALSQASASSLHQMQQFPQQLAVSSVSHMHSMPFSVRVQQAQLPGLVNQTSTLNPVVFQGSPLMQPQLRQQATVPNVPMINMSNQGKYIRIPMRPQGGVPMMLPPMPLPLHMRPQFRPSVSVPSTVRHPVSRQSPAPRPAATVMSITDVTDEPLKIAEGIIDDIINKIVGLENGSEEADLLKDTEVLSEVDSCDENTLLGLDSAVSGAINVPDRDIKSTVQEMNGDTGSLSPGSQRKRKITEESTDGAVNKKVCMVCGKCVDQSEEKFVLIHEAQPFEENNIVKKMQCAGLNIGDCYDDLHSKYLCAGDLTKITKLEKLLSLQGEIQKSFMETKEMFKSSMENGDLKKMKMDLDTAEPEGNQD